MLLMYSLHSIRPTLDFETTTVATFIVLSKLDYCNSLFNIAFYCIQNRHIRSREKSLHTRGGPKSPEGPLGGATCIQYSVKLRPSNNFYVKLFTSHTVNKRLCLPMAVEGC